VHDGTEVQVAEEDTVDEHRGDHGLAGLSFRSRALADSEEGAVHLLSGCERRAD
jgi:hypothetical protein